MKKPVSSLAGFFYFSYLAKKITIMATIKDKNNKILDIYILIVRTTAGEVFVERHNDDSLKAELLRDDDMYEDITFLKEYPSGELTMGEGMIVHTDTSDLIVPRYKVDVEF